MVKKYSSSCVKFTINVTKDGKSIPIVFDRWDQEYRRRWILISDPVIQAMMEKSPDFNVYFRLDGVVEEEVPIAEIHKIAPKVTETEKPKDLITVRKKDLLEAKRWLNSFGIAYSRMKNRETVATIAKEQGYNLVFETSK